MLMLIAALFVIAKVWKQPKCLLTDEWTRGVYTYTICYFCLKMEENPAIFNNMDEPGGHSK